MLDEVSLTIREGQFIALVGENGSGKTTLVKLLCRLYDPSDGVITIGGVDLRDFRSDLLRREFSVIFQDYVHYNLSVLENVALGNPERPPDQARVVLAARRVGVDELISKLPCGYETLLGKWFEDGEELSIGEWQKIALARALYRDAQILVFDEPTSAIDAGAEFEFFKDFRRSITGHTAILISHRLSTVRMADCIFTLKDGRIVESGTHDDLVNAGGEYSRLYHLQASLILGSDNHRNRKSDY